MERYNIRLSNRQLVVVEGYQVKGHQYEPEVSLIVHRAFDDHDKWIVSELKSGFEITHAATRKGAVEKINNVTIDKEVVVDEISKAVNRYGAAN